MPIVLDPALFVSAPHEELEPLFDDVVRACLAFQTRHPGDGIPRARGYWDLLQRELVGPLRGAASPRLARAIDRLRGFEIDDLLPRVAPDPVSARFWHLKPLMTWAGLSSNWLARMETLLVRCALAKKKTLLVTRLIEGRNLRSHPYVGSVLREKTRWRVIVHVKGAQPFWVACVRNLRNLDVPWTVRFDEHLPAEQDGAKCPFCPPDRWGRQSVTAVATVSGRPAWLDARDNGWAPPSTGGGHHWDVYLNSTLTKDFGLPQINVVRFGSPSREGAVGSIHHVPRKKGAHLDSSASWKCLTAPRE